MKPIGVIWTVMLWLLCAAPKSTQAQDWAKAETPEILDIARCGRAQDLTVWWDDSGIVNSIERQISASTREHAAPRVADAMSGAETAQDDALEMRRLDNLGKSLRSRLDSIKKAAFADGKNGRNFVIHDFSHLSAAVVRVSCPLSPSH